MQKNQLISLTEKQDSQILQSSHYSILKYYSAKKQEQENKVFSEIAAQTGIIKTAIEYAIPTEKNVDELLNAAFNYYSVKALRTEEIDGHTFYFNDYWFNIRKSNTMPEIKITIEAQEDKRNNILNEVKSIILS